MSAMSLPTSVRMSCAICRLRIVPACGQVLRKGNRVLGLELRLLAGAARGELVQPLDDDGEIGASLGVVELDDDVAYIDDIAVAHAQFGDHAAGRVLHLLDVGVDDELALRDDRAGEFAGR